MGVMKNTKTARALVQAFVSPKWTKVLGETPNPSYVLESLASVPGLSARMVQAKTGRPGIYWNVYARNERLAS